MPHGQHGQLQHHGAGPQQWGQGGPQNGMLAQGVPPNQANMGQMGGPSRSWTFRTSSTVSNSGLVAAP